VCLVSGGGAVGALTLTRTLTRALTRTLTRTRTPALTRTLTRTLTLTRALMPTIKKRATKDPDIFYYRDANLANQSAKDIKACAEIIYLLCGNCRAVYDKNKGADRSLIHDWREEPFFGWWSEQARKMVADFKERRGTMDKSPEAFGFLGWLAFFPQDFQCSQWSPSPLHLDPRTPWQG
jgi:hypothetical protein